MHELIANVQQNPRINEKELKTRHERHIQDGNKQKIRKRKRSASSAF